MDKATTRDTNNHDKLLHFLYSTQNMYVQITLNSNSIALGKKKLAYN